MRIYKVPAKFMFSSLGRKDLHSMNILRIEFKMKTLDGIRVRYDNYAKGQLLQYIQNCFSKNSNYNKYLILTFPNQ